MLSNNDILLFHGTNQLFERIDLNRAKDKLELIGRDEYDKKIFI